MSALPIARSSLVTALTRYRRSWGIWILLLVAPIGARLFVPRDDGTTIIISVADQLPVMTSSVIGVCLGITVSTLLLPAAYIYLRANTNRRQPWQVEDVSPAARMPIALGRFGADAAMLLAALAALNAAGIFLAWLILPAGALDPVALSFALWVIAAPAMMGLAALRILFDAIPAFRGALGDFAYLAVWIASIAVPSANTVNDTGLLVNMTDFGGFVRPLIFGSGLIDPGFAIGGAAVKPGHIPIDAMAGLLLPGYLPSRLVWAAIAVAIAALAGLVYRPHRTRHRSALSQRAGRLLHAGPVPAADPDAPPARNASRPLAGLLAAEFRLIGASRAFRLIAFLIAAGGVIVDFRSAVLPALLLLLVFGLTAHAGRSETAGLKALTATAATSRWTRRAAFVLAGTGWATLIALPHALVSFSVIGLATAAALGGIGAAAAILLAAFSGSGFAPRIVLLIAWYVYTAS